MTCLMGVLVFRSLVPSDSPASAAGANVWLAIATNAEHKNSFVRNVLVRVVSSPLIAAASGRKGLCACCESNGLHRDCSSKTYGVVALRFCRLFVETGSGFVRGDVLCQRREF